jgi:hypothetical protein
MSTVTEIKQGTGSKSQAYDNADGWLSDAEIQAKHGDLARAIIAIKKSVGRQKGNVYRRWVRARRNMFFVSSLILLLSTGATVVGALSFADDSQAGKYARTLLPAIAGIATAYAALFDVRGRYVREAQAQLKLTRLQSDIEYQLVQSVSIPADHGKETAITPILVDDWKKSLDNILDTVSSEYIAANSKATASRTAGG